MSPQLTARIAIRSRTGRHMLRRLGLIPTAARSRPTIGRLERRGETGDAVLAPAAGALTTRELPHDGGERAVTGSTARPPRG